MALPLIVASGRTSFNSIESQFFNAKENRDSLRDKFRSRKKNTRVTKVVSNRIDFFRRCVFDEITDHLVDHSDRQQFQTRQWFRSVGGGVGGGTARCCCPDLLFPPFLFLFLLPGVTTIGIVAVAAAVARRCFPDLLLPPIGIFAVPTTAAAAASGRTLIAAPVRYQYPVGAP